MIDYKEWLDGAARQLGKEKLTIDEERVAYFAWREAKVAASEDAIKSDHALILNRLHQMQHALPYASVREELSLAETTILQLEQEVRRLKQMQSG